MYTSRRNARRLAKASLSILARAVATRPSRILSLSRLPPNISEHDLLRGLHGTMKGYSLILMHISFNLNSRY